MEQTIVVFYNYLCMSQNPSTPLLTQNSWDMLGFVDVNPPKYDFFIGFDMI